MQQTVDSTSNFSFSKYFKTWIRIVYKISTVTFKFESHWTQFTSTCIWLYIKYKENVYSKYSKIFKNLIISFWIFVRVLDAMQFHPNVIYICLMCEHTLNLHLNCFCQKTKLHWGVWALSHISVINLLFLCRDKLCTHHCLSKKIKPSSTKDQKTGFFFNFWQQIFFL